MRSAVREGARHVLRHCGGLQQRERVAIIGSDDAREIAVILADEALQVSDQVEMHLIPRASMHGVEPPSSVADVMAGADLIVAVTSKSMAHTKARLRASQTGARYLSLPEYSTELLGADDLRVDYIALGEVVRRVSDRLTAGKEILVTSKRGTHLVARIEGRIGNCCPGFVHGPGSLGSPPDVEANISPLETASQGEIVVDGSIAHPTIGVLPDPVKLRIERGMIQGWDGPLPVMKALERLFAGRPENARVLAECGIGMNPKAKLRGIMLTDEGCAGAVHFGFGSNATVGGANAVDFHLDFCMRDATLTVDDESLLQNGIFAPWVGFPVAQSVPQTTHRPSRVLTASMSEL